MLRPDGTFVVRCAGREGLLYIPCVSVGWGACMFGQVCTCVPLLCICVKVSGLFSEVVCTCVCVCVCVCVIPVCHYCASVCVCVCVCVCTCHTCV